MKKLLRLTLLFPLLSFFPSQDRNELIGIWELNQITLNNDTVFFRGQFDYILKHNFELNKNWIINDKDSLTLTKRAEKAYQNSMSIKMEFMTDSTFKMTKVRSGGRISPKEIDYGIYEINSDTLLMINQSREDYKNMFLIDLENKRIYQEDGVLHQIVYQEYTKKN